MTIPNYPTLLFATLFASGLALAADPPNATRGDINHVNRSIHIGNGERAEDLGTVNGSIVVGDDASIDTAETVNGSVRLGRASRANALETVNGSIAIGPDAVIAGSVETVNGSIKLDERARVQDDAENVNGSLRLAREAHIGGRITTYNGDISIGEAVQVEGGIVVKKSRGWNWFGTQRRPQITIAADAVVGDMIFEHEVELRVHPSARIGRVEGATVQPLESTSQPSADQQPER
ncbi:MAG: hypothetical protein AB7F83_14105 [Lysobacterales bacterium]